MRRSLIIQRSKSLMRSLTRAIHTILGVPCYDAYLTHFIKYHPGENPLSEKEFYRKKVDERDGDGKVRRCC